MNVARLEQFHQRKSNDETDSRPFEASQNCLEHPAQILTQARATLKRTCGLPPPRPRRHAAAARQVGPYFLSKSETYFS